jgi:thiol-disulfide isomerase/thioredoxin
MKKVMLTVSLILLSVSVFAQKIIENPKFSATTADYVKITRIELLDTITRMDFEVEYFPNWWIYISSTETFIQNSEGGDKLLILGAEGINLDEQHKTPQSGKNFYTLYFPPIDLSVKAIDYLESEWKIFDIELSPKEVFSFIPEELQGNWLRTDGSNEWFCGIYDNRIIYKGELWEKVLIKNKGKNYQIVLQKDGKQENLEISIKKQNLLIDSNTGKKELFSKTKTFNPHFKLIDDEEIKIPVFSSGTAIYKGYIDGYHPKMGTTGMVHVNDILMLGQNSHLITIHPDGSFYVEVPMIHPQKVYVVMQRIHESIYLEPGKTVFHYIDLSEYSKPFKNNIDRSKRERKSLFMGESARVNADLMAMDFISFYNYNQAQKLILDMSPAEYKEYCLEILNKELNALNAFEAKNTVSKKALQIRRLEIPYNAYMNILSYNSNRGYAYRVKNKIPNDQREIPLEKEIMEPSFYDFINVEDLNNPISLLSGGSYYILINRIRFSESIRPKSILVHTMEDYKNLQYENLNTYFGIKTGFAKDIMLAQDKCGTMMSLQKPFSESEKEEIRNKITNTFIADYIIQQSIKLEKEIAATLAANKTKTGYVINETPKTDGDKLFEAIVSKYKGKIVFIDFWATWCAPCRSGMENIKPLKEELEGKDIEFVYITNHTSPLETWNRMVPDIKGQHYRIEPDEWNKLASRFNISGIPHYMLVDKSGNIVKDKIYFASSNSELRKMFEEYLNP